MLNAYSLITRCADRPPEAVRAPRQAPQPAPRPRPVAVRPTLTAGRGHALYDELMKNHDRARSRQT